MPSKVTFERFFWFHHQVRKGWHPNAVTLAERFEIAVKTAIQICKKYLQLGEHTYPHAISISSKRR